MKLLKVGSGGIDRFIAPYVTSGVRILNAGCGNRRYGMNCLNVDISPRKNVDLAWDLNEALPSHIGTFSVVVCVAVLQYCRDPQQVVKNLYAVLEPGGVLYLSAPWVQQVCFDTHDLYRFSDVGLRYLVENAGFTIKTVLPGIRPGSALAWLAWEIADSATRSRWVNVGLRTIVGAVLRPIRHMRTTTPHRSSGSFYCVAVRGGAALRSPDETS